MKNKINFMVIGLAVIGFSNLGLIDRASAYSGYAEDSIKGEIIKINPERNTLVVYDRSATQKETFFLHSNALSKLSLGESVRVDFSRPSALPINIR